MITKEVENSLSVARELWNNDLSINCTEIVWRRIKSLEKAGKLPIEDLSNFLDTLPYFNERGAILKNVLNQRNVMSLPLPTLDSDFIRRMRESDNGWS